MVVGSLLIAGGVAATQKSNFSNIWIHPNLNRQQIEMSIAVSPLDPTRLLVGANVGEYRDPPHDPPYIFWSQGYYYSTNSGATWDGSDTLPAFGGTEQDPAVAFDTSGNAYFAYI